MARRATSQVRRTAPSRDDHQPLQPLWLPARARIESAGWLPCAISARPPNEAEAWAAICSVAHAGMRVANFRAQPNHLVAVCIGVVVHHAKGDRPERKASVFARAHETIEKSVRLREKLKDNLEARRLLVAKFKQLTWSWWVSTRSVREGPTRDIAGR
jgi:hypothetical protein